MQFGTRIAQACDFITKIMYTGVPLSALNKGIFAGLPSNEAAS